MVKGRTEHYVPMHTIFKKLFLVNDMDVMPTVLAKQSIYVTTSQHNIFPFYFFGALPATTEDNFCCTGHHNNREIQHAQVANKSIDTLLTGLMMSTIL